MGTLKLPLRVGFDTNIFIYQFHEHPKFGAMTHELFVIYERTARHGFTSSLTLVELLSFRLLPTDLKRIKELFFEIPFLTIVPLEQKIGIEAARIRREYNFTLPDAVQLASCISIKADVFITNDKKLTSFPELPVMLLSELK